MIYDKAQVHDYLTGVLRHQNLELNNLVPLHCESVALYQMFKNGQNLNELKIGFFGDIHVSPVGMLEYMKYHVSNGNRIAVMTRWRGLLMRELFYNEDQITLARNYGVTMLVHESCLFTEIVVVPPGVDVFGNPGPVWSYGSSSKSQIKPVYQFAGFYFNMQQF